MYLRLKTILSDITSATLLGWAPPKICKEWGQVRHQFLQQRAGDSDDILIWCNSLWSIRAAFWCVIKWVTGKMWDDVWGNMKHKTNRIRQIWSHRIMDYVTVQSVQTGPAIPQVLAGRRQGGSQTKRQHDKNILLLLQLLLQYLLQPVSLLYCQYTFNCVLTSESNIWAYSVLWYISFYNGLVYVSGILGMLLLWCFLIITNVLPLSHNTIPQ